MIPPILCSRLIVASYSFWKRLIKDGSPGSQQRFMSTMDTFFQAITIQAKDRKDGVIPDLDSYISVRRDTSGCRPCWALTEYANGLDIPDEVMGHPVVEALGEAANDLVTWSNVSPPCQIVTPRPAHKLMTGHLLL